MPKERLLHQLSEVKVIRKGPCILKSGADADVYCDIKKAFGYPDIRDQIVKEIKKLLHPSVTCVAGSGYGGLQLAMLIADRYDLKLTAVRVEPKEYGLANPIGGYVPGRKDVIAAVDDVFSSGGSIRYMLNILATTNAKFADAVVVVNRGDERNSPVPLRYIFKLEELL